MVFILETNPFADVSTQHESVENLHIYIRLVVLIIELLLSLVTVMLKRQSLQDVYFV